MTNEQIWKLACQQTLINVAQSLLNRPEAEKSLFKDDLKDVIVSDTYSKIGEKLLTSFQIPKIPKELK